MAKRRQVREQPEQLVARVVAIDPSYFLIMENLGNDRPADEEAILNLTGKICWISRRHKQHIGREVDISLISSQRWGKASSRSRLFGSVSIKKQGCGVYVYMPAISFYGISPFINLDDCMVDLDFERNVSRSIVYGYTASAQPDGSGSKFLRITDIQDGKVNWDTVPFVAPAPKDLERCRLRSGDIVFARSGATVGKSFLVEAPPRDAVFASYLIRVRVDENRIQPEVAAYYFQSDEYWTQIRKGATGTGQPNFNGSKLSHLLVPVGEDEAQRQAIATIRSAFARADRLEAEAARARSLLDRLEASILAKAFRGELAPQDPADEPASALLDRIRVQRAAKPNARRGSRRSGA